MSSNVLGALMSFALVATTLGGCAVGLDSVLFVTKTGVSIDADTQPASLDFGYAREEFVLQPIYEGGQSLPVLTTVGVEGTGLTFGANHSFATGPSAVVMADAFDSKDRYELGVEGGVPKPRMDGKIVTTLPNDIPGGFDPFGWISYFFSSDANRKRYFFGTDTNLGLHVEWGGNDIPRSVSVGYKRKELAYVPLIEQPSYVNTLAADKPAYTPPQMEGMVAAKVRLDPTGRPWVATTADPQSAADFKRFDKARDGDSAAPEGELISMEEAIRRGAISSSSTVGLASLIATAHVGTRVEGFKNSGARVNQTFATGAAATLLATQPGIRRALGPVLIPNWDEAKSQLDLSGGETVAKMAFLKDVYTVLHRMSDKGDEQAENLVGRWDGLVAAADREAYSKYTFAAGTLLEQRIPAPPNAVKKPFNLIPLRWAASDLSAVAIRSALGNATFQFFEASAPASAAEKAKVRAFNDRAESDKAAAAETKQTESVKALTTEAGTLKQAADDAKTAHAAAEQDVTAAKSKEEDARAAATAAAGTPDEAARKADFVAAENDRKAKEADAAEKKTAADTADAAAVAKQKEVVTAQGELTKVQATAKTAKDKADKSWAAAAALQGAAGGARAVPATDTATRSALNRTASKLETQRDEAAARLENDPAIRAGVDYFVKSLQSKGAK